MLLLDNNKNQMFQYKTNFYMNKTVEKAIKNFESTKKQLILKEKLKNCNLIEEVQISQVKNEYYCNSLDNSAFLFIYHYNLRKENIDYRVIQIDKNIIPRLKEKIWRCWNNTIVAYILNPLNNKKIDLISIRSEILNCGAKSQIVFKSNNLDDYREKNLLLKQNIDKFDNKTDPNIVQEYQKNINLNNLIISNKELRDINKNYSKLVSKFRNNFYYLLNKKEVLLLIYNKLKNKFYKVLIDYDDFKTVSQFYWSIRGAGFSQKTRHPSHVIYAQNHTWKLHQFIYCKGDLFVYKKNIRDKLIIDHINRNTLDNRKNNLRLATIQENNRNQNTRRNNKCGVTGIYQSHDGWVAARTIYPKGRFANPKRRAITCKDFETAVLMRKKLEKIFDEVFLSNKKTSDIIMNNTN